MLRIVDATMNKTDSEHLADIVVYWQSLPSSQYKVEALEGDQRLKCDFSRPDWHSVIQKWRERKLGCLWLWLCEQHAAENGFGWKADGTTTGV
jgi:hypothetical protein